MKYHIENRHISTIRCGDTVIIDGIMKTVGKKDIKYDSFMGWSLFGDSYKLGNVPVKFVVMETNK